MKVILDTNVWVAAGFNPDSSSARIVEAISDGRLRMVWNKETRRESERIVQRIPPLAWKRFADLFRPEDRFEGVTEPERFEYISDPDDRKFAALAAATGATLITNDEHLLAHRQRSDVSIIEPSEFGQQHKF
jgi:predicted nucleic acid-binding protein